MRKGVRLGIDVGQVRIGVARTDPQALMAVPVETIARRADDSSQEGFVNRIQQLVNDFSVMEVIVGLPLNLRGERTPSTSDALEFARTLAKSLPDVPIRLVDERLSTVSATRSLQSAGKSTREQRNVIDQQAAVVLLEHALESERSQAEPAGTLISDILD